jgi:hypothetical protein
VSDSGEDIPQTVDSTANNDGRIGQLNISLWLWLREELSLVQRRGLLQNGVEWLLVGI